MTGAPNKSSSVIIALLLALAFGCGERHERANAVELEHDLGDMRKAIGDFRRDHGHPPATLSDLVGARYLAMIPNDPLTGRPDWRVIVEQPVRVDEFQSGAQNAVAGGIVDVHSSALGTDSNGKAWSDY